MINWKHKLLASALAVAVAVPGGVFAAEAATGAHENNGGTPAQGTRPFHVETLHKKHHKVRAHMHVGPHREMYMTLLAEKYTPQDLNEWRATFAERERILNELKSLRQKGEGSGEHQKQVRQWKEQAKNGEITREGLWERLKLWRSERKEPAGEAGDERRKEWEEFLQAHRELHEEFTKAVDSQDAEAIKHVLPKLLEEAKRINEHLAKKLEEVKKNGPNPPAE